MTQTAFTLPLSSASNSSTAGSPGVGEIRPAGTPQCRSIAARSSATATLR
jgi:hypothetical protein